MPSPFPGMDVYLEDPAYWPDFHHRFITSWCDILTERLPDTYDVRFNERVHLVQMSPDRIKAIYPDLAILDTPATRSPTSQQAGAAVLEPVTIPHEFVEEVRETHIEIFHLPDRMLVAVLELLSPTNKTGEGFQDYRAKRKAILQQKVHLVEVDLLLGGQRLPLSRPLPGGDYFAFVTRGDGQFQCEVFACRLNQELPAIPIPLHAPDPDFPISLQRVFEAAYDRGRYRRILPYTQPPVAMRSRDDIDWALETANPTS